MQIRGAHIILFSQSKKNLQFLIAFTCASVFLSLPVSFCVSKSTQQKGPIITRWACLSGSLGVLNHLLLPKQSSTSFTTNDPTPPYITEDVLAKEKASESQRFLGLNEQESTAINSSKQCVGSLHVTFSLTKNIIFYFLVELVLQCGYYIVNLRYLLSASVQTELLLLLFAAIFVKSNFFFYVKWKTTVYLVKWFR